MIRQKGFHLSTRRISASLTAMAAIAFTHVAHAAPLDTAQALDLITKTADSICNVVSTKGDAESSEVKGEVKAQLSGLASKLADAGISGVGSINNAQYQNVLRQDLASTIKDNARCKLTVFEELQSKLIGSASSTQQSGSITNGAGSTPRVSNIQQELDLNGGQSILLTDDRIIFTVIGHPFAANGNVIGVKVEGKVKGLMSVRP